jgi:hypothetical protein
MGMKECGVFEARHDGGCEVDKEAVSFSAWLSKNKKRIEERDKAD